ncbi:MAG: TonB-dependent receptor [Methylotenera sp.]
MNKPNKRCPQTGSSRSPSFKMRPIAVACSGLLFIATSSYAQEPVETSDADTADSTETVVVTGIRHSIETSISAKKESDSIVEVVTAEDIGKLPDVSIAENLARLPGLTAQRVDGRAQSISIRGMGPKYGVTLLNNREVVSTGENRSVEYDQFPSELINSAVVYKTPDASLSALGLSGTVNLKTVRPLDLNERKVSVSVRAERAGNGELNSGTDDLGGRFSASYIDQFADNRVGIALGYAHLDNPGQEKYYKSWGWQDNSLYDHQDWCGGNCVSPGLKAGQTAITGYERGVISSDRKRDGLMAALEFKPNENFHSMVDLYYTKFDQKSVQSEEQAFLGGMWSGVNYTNPVVNGQGVVTSATVNNVNNAVLLSRYNKRKDDTFAIGWNNELKLDKWKFGADLSYSKAKRDEYNGEMTAHTAGPVNFQTLVSTTGISHFIPSVNLADPNLVQLSHMWGHGGRATMPHVEDDMKAFRLTVERAFDNPVIASVDGGVTYSERTKEMNRSEEYYDLKNGGASVVISPSLITSGVPGALAWDYKGALGQYYGAPYTPKQPWLEVGRNWGVEEQVTTLYGKVNFDVDMTVPVRGNVGFQAIHTSLTAKGNYWDGTSVRPMTADHDYNDFLPSLNMTFDFGNLISKGLFLRFGAANEMARPTMESMRAGLDANMSAPLYLWNAKGGNPNLDPWRAEAYDLSLEKYFGKRSYLQVAYFEKHLQNPIYNQTLKHDFTGVGLPAGVTPPPGFNVNPNGTLTAPANGSAGYVKGTEVSASLDAGLFVPALDGFGFIGSVSSTQSSISERGSNIYGDSFATNSPLEGLSGIVRSLTAYYERHGFSARISERYRSSFTAITRDQFGDPSLSIIEPEAIVDMQLGYAFETGQLKGLSVLFQVNNLTDEPYRTSVSATGNTNLTLPERYNTYGRQYLLGATYKF